VEKTTANQLATKEELTLYFVYTLDAVQPFLQYMMNEINQPIMLLTGLAQVSIAIPSDCAPNLPAHKDLMWIIKGVNDVSQHWFSWAMTDTVPPQLASLKRPAESITPPDYTTNDRNNRGGRNRNPNHENRQQNSTNIDPNTFFMNDPSYQGIIKSRNDDGYIKKSIPRLTI